MDAQVITFGLNGITEEQFRGGVRCGCADVREPSRTAREDLAPGPRDQHLWRSVPVGRPGGVRALHQGRGLQCDQGRREPEGRRVPRLWRLRGSVFTHHAEAARRVSRAGGQSRGECSKAGDASGPARAAVRRRRRPIGVQTLRWRAASSSAARVPVEVMPAPPGRRALPRSSTGSRRRVTCAGTSPRPRPIPTSLASGTLQVELLDLIDALAQDPELHLDMDFGRVTSSGWPTARSCTREPAMRTTTIRPVAGICCGCG